MTTRLATSPTRPGATPDPASSAKVPLPRSEQRTPSPAWIAAPTRAQAQAMGGGCGLHACSCRGLCLLSQSGVGCRYEMVWKRSMRLGAAEVRGRRAQLLVLVVTLDAGSGKGFWLSLNSQMQKG
ncbi:hypothetical protein B0T14DRAFT_159691 [Immersiella caudata]|uniref:Uncharacterized protein n=1 Tax=Immersiella caudata TaxID=314043 RepID=A0AA40C2V4_9PEZI|nr:hypothetical protein B0T14DRAFT_159691 [Immersiella caudata]